jgi:Raf kinase inhibitor-like YbhB/YbcL family protein
MMRKILTCTLALTVALTLGLVAQEKGKGGGKGKGGFSLPPKIMLTIDGFADGGNIPAKFTAATSPKISWTQVPAGTQAFVLLMHDPDPVLGNNPDPDVTHWLLYNIPGTATGLPEGVPAGATLPDGTVQARGLTNQNAYFGPGPPAGHGVHHYTFELWALNAKIDVPPGDIATVRAAVMNAMKGKVIGKGYYIGLYENK